eukprot:8465531-Pyramimonas_sp.AAC.1
MMLQWICFDGDDADADETMIVVTLMMIAVTRIACVVVMNHLSMITGAVRFDHEKDGRDLQ